MLKKLAFTLALLVILLVGGVLVAQRVSDGPMGPLQGGNFKTGEIVAEPVDDWSTVRDLTGSGEILLVGPGTSRITGLLLHRGKLYIPCDLGFMANRDWDSAATEWFGLAMAWFKRWHRDAIEDGRAIVRLGGKLYGGQLTKVTDPDLEHELRALTEQVAREFGGLEVLPPAPAEEPNDIWFFHVSPRAL
jgi:hypothetical protein